MNKAERLQQLAIALNTATTKTATAGKTFSDVAAAARTVGMNHDAVAKTAWETACLAYGEAQKELTTAQAAYETVLNEKAQAPPASP